MAKNPEVHSVKVPGVRLAYPIAGWIVLDDHVIHLTHLNLIVAIIFGQISSAYVVIHFGEHRRTGHVESSAAHEPTEISRVASGVTVVLWPVITCADGSLYAVHRGHTIVVPAVDCTLLSVEDLKTFLHIAIRRHSRQGMVTAVETFDIALKVKGKAIVTPGGLIDFRRRWITDDCSGSGILQKRMSSAHATAGASHHTNHIGAY
mmetsp:Transcript_7874/g.17022  ORF Transcript_7874/g.17022 Transcript_7874/m.17022 type:complete len:205 (+) Transcript_7874:804-1418(+)